MAKHQSAEAAVLGLSTSFSLVVGFATFFMPVFLRDSLHFSGAAIGLLYAALSLTSLASAFPAGVCNDRAGSRAPLLVAILAAACAVAGQALAHFLWLYLPLYLLYGLASNVFRISLDSLFLRHQNDSRRFGAYSAARLAGLGVGTLSCGWLLARLDFPLTLLLLAGFTLGLVLFLPWLPKSRGCPTRLAGYGEEFLGRPAALFFAAWLFLFTTHWGAEYTSYGLFLRHGLGLSLAGMGYFMTAQFAVVALAAWAGGRLLQAGVGADRLLTTGLVSSGLGAVLMATPDLHTAFVFRAVHEVGDGLLTVVVYVRIASLFGSQRIGGHVGMVQFVSTLGALCGSLVFGPLGASHGYAVPLGVSGLITLGLLPLLALWERRAVLGRACAQGPVARLVAAFSSGPRR